MASTGQTDLTTLEAAVKALSDDALQAFSEWLDDYLSQRWDKAIAQDPEPLRRLAAQALKEHECGETTPL